MRLSGKLVLDGGDDGVGEGVCLRLRIRRLGVDADNVFRARGTDEGARRRREAGHDQVDPSLKARRSSHSEEM